MKLAILFTILIAFVFPIAYFIYLLVTKKGASTYLLGFATFFIFQILLRIPLMQVVNYNFPLLSLNTWFYAIYLGLGAGLFEEVGRYIMMKLGMRNKLTTKDAVIFGIGHFSCEALLLVGINYVAFLIMNYYPSTSSFLYFLAGLERLFVLPVHVAMSILVMKSIRDKKPSLTILAIVLHACIDGITVLMQMEFGLSVGFIEGFVFVCAILCLLYWDIEVKKEKML